MFMENAIIEAAMSQGIWVVLFVSLFFYTIKKYEKLEDLQNSREQNYQITISDLTELLNNLTEKYAVIESMNKEIEAINSFIHSDNK